MSVSISSGANTENNLELAGQTVAQVRQRFGEALSIPAGARATVNNKAVDETYVLRDGDRLAFVKNTAEKGVEIVEITI